MPRQMPTTLGPRIRAQARGGSLLLTFPIGGRGSRHRRPLPDRPPTLQAFRSVLSETTSVSTRRLIKGSRSYLRRHGVQSRGAAISYHKVALAVYRKFCCARKACRRTGQSPPPTPLRPLRSLRLKIICSRCERRIRAGRSARSAPLAGRRALRRTESCGGCRPSPRGSPALPSARGRGSRTSTSRFPRRFSSVSYEKCGKTKVNAPQASCRRFLCRLQEGRRSRARSSSRASRFP